MSIQKRTSEDRRTPLIVNTPAIGTMPLSTKASRLFKTLRGHKQGAKDVELQRLRVLRDRSQSDQAGAAGAFEPPQSRRVAERAGATSTTGKRKRGSMVQNAILIHEDGHAQSRPSHKLRKMESRHQVILLPHEENEPQEMDDEETSSEASIETEEDIDESVAEDMRKLEESFKGISQKYRLINRIGEGSIPIYTFQCSC